jgi:hypothetical protein
MNKKAILEAAFLFGGATIFGVWSFVSCGISPSGDGDKDVVIVQPGEPVPPAPTPENPGTPTPTPTPVPDQWEREIKPLVQEQCALSGCHAGAKFLASERAIKASLSADVIANGRMPKTESINYELWNDAKKAKMLAFLRAP